MRTCRMFSTSSTKMYHEAMADPAEVAKFEAAAEAFRQREAAKGNVLSVKQAQEEFDNLLQNLVEHPLEIFALRIGLEELEARVAALETAAGG